MNEIYCKAGRVELTKEEAFKIYDEKKYVVASYGIYQPNYSQAQCRVYFTKLLDIKGLTRRGRFCCLTSEDVNRLLGYNLIIA